MARTTSTLTPRGQKRSPLRSRSRRQIVIVIVVALSVIAGWTLLAHSGALDSLLRQKEKKSSTVSTQSFNSSSPAKEYVYAGGRLVATEEPTTTSLSPPTNLRAITSSSTSIHITWNSVAGATRYELQKSSNYGAANHGFGPVNSNITLTSFDETVTSGNAYVYQVLAIDQSGNFSAPSNLDVATAIAFTEDPVSTGLTVKEVHITQLRQAVDAIRVASGLFTATWSDPPPLAQIVTIKKLHMDQLRANLDSARVVLSLPLPTYTDSTITQIITPVRAAHVQELRRLVKGYLTAIDTP